MVLLKLVGSGIPKLYVVDVKIVCRVETVGGASTITKIDYAEGNVGSAFTTGSIVWFGGADGLSTNLAGYGLTI